MSGIPHVSGHIIEAVRWDCPSCNYRGFIDLAEVLRVVEASEKQGKEGVCNIRCSYCLEPFLVDPTNIYRENGTSLKLIENV